MNHRPLSASFYSRSPSLHPTSSIPSIAPNGSSINLRPVTGPILSILNSSTHGAQIPNPLPQPPAPIGVSPVLSAFAPNGDRHPAHHVPASQTRGEPGLYIPSPQPTGTHTSAQAVAPVSSPAADTGSSEVSVDGDAVSEPAPIEKPPEARHSCHQCKHNMPMSEIIFCMNPEPCAATLRQCRKKYCFLCLRGYGTTLQLIDSVDSWVCPSCLGDCCCAHCKRIANDTADAPPRIRVSTRKSRRKPKVNANAHLLDVHRALRAEMQAHGQSPATLDASEPAEAEAEQPRRKRERRSARLAVTADTMVALPAWEEPEELPARRSRARGRLGPEPRGDPDARTAGIPRPAPIVPLPSDPAPSTAAAFSHSFAPSFPSLPDAPQSTSPGIRPLPSAFPPAPEQMPPISISAPAHASALPTETAPSASDAVSTSLAAFAEAIRPRVPATVVQAGPSDAVRLAEVDDAGWDLSLLYMAGHRTSTRDPFGGHDTLRDVELLGLSEVEDASLGTVDLGNVDMSLASVFGDWDGGQTTPLALRSRSVDAEFHSP